MCGKRSLVANSSTLVPSGSGIQADVHFAELAAAAGLFFVAVAAFGFLLDRFAVGDFRLVRIDLHFVALQ